MVNISGLFLTLVYLFKLLISIFRCSIWLESKCRAENQSSYDYLQWSFTANKTEIFLPGNSTLFNISQIIDESFPIKTSVVEFMLQDVTEGSFQCHHGEHASNIVNTTLILGPKVRTC